MQVQSFLILILRFLLLFSMGSYFTTHLPAQAVYTQLKQSRHISTFTEISNHLVCQCGCNFILSLCPHVECPWGIPARRFIESRILAGYSQREILDGFQNGFGPSLNEDLLVKELVAKGILSPVRLEELVQGYGARVSSEHSLIVPILFIILIIVVASWLVFRWYRRNFNHDKL